MSWNEVKIGLAPKGAVIFSSRDKKLVTEDGYPVQVLSARLPDSENTVRVLTSQVEGWLLKNDFRIHKKGNQSVRLIRDDVELLIVNNGNIVEEIILNFRLELNARERIVCWDQFVRDICREHQLQLFDSKNGLVAPDAFQDSVKRSFAWECFLRREKHFSKIN